MPRIRRILVVCSDCQNTRCIEPSGVWQYTNIGVGDAEEAAKTRKCKDNVKDQGG